jgi:hypothetical protein
LIDHHFDITVGTTLIFETIPKDNAASNNNNAKNEQDVKYHSMSTKRLKLKRVFLETKKKKKSKVNIDINTKLNYKTGKAKKKSKNSEVVEKVVE